MSGPQRNRRLAQPGCQYDVAVVGGGIYGAAVAWEAASRGLGVIVLERADFASGTSANSLKTIHGGLRSLQRLDFREMREYIRERRALMRIAPHLVSPIPCLMPTYRAPSRSRLFIGAGLKLYDLVAWDRNRGLDGAHRIPPSRLIPRSRLAELAPGLDQAGATGAASWFDGQVYNSERLTLSFLMSAARAGAEIFNYLERTAYHFDNGRVCGLSVRDRLSGEESRLGARTVIDCSGPWASLDPGFRENIRTPGMLARAVNLVIRRRLADCALGVKARAGAQDGGRLLFSVPWRQGSIVGTWYYPESGMPDSPGLDEAELSACLRQINSVFPGEPLSPADVTLLHVGLQPAHRVSAEGREPRLWRHSRILQAGTGREGLYWVQGVKLTTARATATRLVERVARYLQKTIRPSRTHETPLYGAEFADYRSYLDRCLARLSEHYPEHAIRRLVANYGSLLDRILALAEQDRDLAGLVPGTTDTIKAELKFVLENEMPQTLADVVMRRTDLGSFARPNDETLEYCADTAAAYFNWDEAERRRQLGELLRHYPAVPDRGGAADYPEPEKRLQQS